MSEVDLSISLVSHNSSLLLENCLKSIYENTQDLTFEIFLVDNASFDNTVQMVKEKFPKVKLTINSENALFTKAHNQNLKRVRSRYFLVLNDDTEIHPKTIKTIISFMDAHPNAGLVSCRQVNEKGITDMTCSRLPHPFIELFEASFVCKLTLRIFPVLKVRKMLSDFRYSGWKRDTIREVDVIPGSFFLGRKILLEKVGLFDESLRLFYQEPDYCKRAIDNGFLTYHIGNVSITHLRAKTLAKLPVFKRYTISEHDMLVYYKKYFGIIWWFILWLAFRPNWLYWKIKSNSKY